MVDPPGRPAAGLAQAGVRPEPPGDNAPGTGLEPPPTEVPE